MVAGILTMCTAYILDWTKLYCIIAVKVLQNKWSLIHVDSNMEFGAIYKCSSLLGKLLQNLSSNSYTAWSSISNERFPNIFSLLSTSYKLLQFYIFMFTKKISEIYNLHCMLNLNCGRKVSWTEHNQRVTFERYGLTHLKHDCPFQVLTYPQILAFNIKTYIKVLYHTIQTMTTLVWTLLKYSILLTQEKHQSSVFNKSKYCKPFWV